MSTGQTLNDRLTAAKHTLAGQGLARIVCKATTEEVIGPKKKHIDNLIHCTNEPNVSIPQLANLLIERTQQNSWVVVFKSLITVHHLMCYGNERFTQYLASSNCTFQLGSFIDKCGVQGYDMSTFIRRYAKYLNEKAIAYRTVAFDFCKCKRGKEDGILRQMNTEKLLKTLPTLQNQLDALLEFDCSSNDLSNGVVSSSFMLLFRDLIRLFACYNDGIINLLEKYFEMNKKHCRDALDIYKKFLIRMDRVAEFLKVAENVGIDKGEIPDLTKLTETCRKLPLFESDDAPSSLLEALEQHLATLEGRKGSTSAASAATRATNLRNAVSALSHTSNAFGSAGENGSPSQEINGVKVDESVRKAVEEEAEVMSQLKNLSSMLKMAKFDNESPLLWEQPAWEDSERRMKDLATGEMISPPGGITKTNPFLASPAEPAGMQGNQAILDLFSSPTSPSGGGSGKNDLLSLNNNPFADSLFGGSQDQQGQQQDQTSFPSFGTNGFTSATTPSVSAFASDASFAAAFGDNTPDFPVVTSPAVATPSEITTVKLSLPVMEPFGGRSTSPSPTTDLMRGAGTTPILANPPDGGFGDAIEGTDDAAPTSTANEEPSDFTWGTDMAGVKAEQSMPPSTTSGTDPFGAPFEPQSSTPQPPTAVVPPLSVRTSDSKTPDLFGLDSSEFGDFGEQPSSAQPCAPPPSPFGGLDLVGGPDLRAQAMANAGGILPPGMALQQKTSQGATGIDNLNFAIQKAMQMPSAMSPTSFPQQPMPGTGMMAPGFGSQPFPPMNVCLPPGSTPPASTAFTQFDNFGGSGMAGTPSARASSTPGYGTPPSGLSSPAKSVSGVGVHGSGGFDAFGDTLQPQTPTGKQSAVEKPANSILKGDLESTLANLACNLDINGPKQSFKKTTGHQWGSPKPAAKTAGSAVPGWAGAPGVAPPATGAPGVGMGWSASPQHGFQQPGAPTGGQWGGAFQQQVPATGVLPQQPYMVGGVRPGMTGMGMNMGMPAQQGMPQQTQMFPGFSPQMAVVPPTSAALPSQAAPVSDPFGAL